MGERFTSVNSGMNINLKFMQTFLLVAELQSFRRAAEACDRSQSAVSMQIRQLEEQLGVSLFNRTTRSVRLTPEGNMLFENGRRAMRELELGLDRIRQASRTGQMAQARVANRNG